MLPDVVRISKTLQKNDKIYHQPKTFPDFIIASPKSEIQPVIGFDEVRYHPLIFCEAEGFCYCVIILGIMDIFGATFWTRKKPTRLIINFL